MNIPNPFNLRRLAALVLLLSIVAGPAAFALTAEQFAGLGTGEAVVRVMPDTAGADGLVEAAIEISAPASQVWAVLLDCARAPNFMPALKACNVLQSDPKGAWDVREHRVSWISLLPDTRNVFRSEYVKNSEIRFSRVEGDFKVMEGNWRLVPLNGGTRTRLFYRARIGIAMLVPSFMLRSALQSDVPKFLMALRHEIERS